MNTAPAVTRVWSFCTTRRDDGVGYGEYLEQLTYLIFLKMANEYAKLPYSRDVGIPDGVDWTSLTARRVTETGQSSPRRKPVREMGTTSVPPDPGGRRLFNHSIEGGKPSRKSFRAAQSGSRRSSAMVSGPPWTKPCSGRGWPSTAAAKVSKSVAGTCAPVVAFAPASQS